jgi:hypothetical protein
MASFSGSPEGGVSRGRCAAPECPAPVTNECGWCGTEDYCSRTCQKRAWPTHKAACELSRHLVVHFDGSARPNPGRGGFCASFGLIGPSVVSEPRHGNELSGRLADISARATSPSTGGSSRGFAASCSSSGKRRPLSARSSSWATRSW